MGKNKQNSKAVAANAKKELAKNDKNRAAQKAEEDAKWKDEGKDKASQKKAAAEAKKAAEMEKRKAKKALVEEEDAKAAKMSKGGKGAAGSQKVTQAQLAKRKDKLAQEEEKKKAAQRELARGITPQIKLESNTNRPAEGDDDNDEQWLNNVTEALKTMKLSASGADKHPEKRLKAAYKAYREVQLPILKEEFPSLKRTQLQQKLWDQWQKSPENPLANRRK